MKRDSLGVPLEPENKAVAEDWMGEDLYADDLVYVTDYGLLRDSADDIEEFMNAAYPNKMTVDEYLFDQEYDI